LKIGTIPSAEGVPVKAGNLQCTGRDLDALGRCAGRDDCPAPSDTRTAGTVSILLGAERVSILKRTAPGVSAVYRGSHWRCCRRCCRGRLESGSQLVSNGGHLDQVSWSTVGANAAGGAVAGAITGATWGTWSDWRCACRVGANVVGSAVTRTAEGEDTSASDVAKDALAGYAGGTLGHVAACM
jgi:hypothetical protein